MTPVNSRQPVSGRQIVRGRWITAFSTTLPAQGAEFVMEPARGWTSHGFDWASGGMLAGLRPKQRAATSQRAPRVAHAQHDQHQLPGRQIITEELFGGVLERERRRADRFDEVFAVLLIDLKPAVTERPVVVNAVIDALGATMRESDVLGWVERPVVIGVVLAPVQSLSKDAARDVESRVRREFAGRLDAVTLASISVRLFVHSRPVSVADGVTGVHTLPAELRFERPRPVCDAFKRALDVTASALLLALLMPLFLVIAALVKLTSPGPVLFRQRRVGQSAKPFTMLKFRTMKVDAEQTLHQQFVTDFIKSGSHAQEPGTGKVFKITDDPRVTPIGRFLRKTSLDELPQFWNVLIGEMSLVGPRPPLQYEVEQYRSWHWRRVLEAKPGITGLWQVGGRSRTTFDEMVRLDLRYVRTRSLWTDVRILLATPRAVVSGRGAC